MAVNIELPQSPVPRSTALVLAEAALQRQNSLLGASTPADAASARPAAATSVPVVPAAAAPGAAPVPASPVAQDRLSLSAEARQRLAAEALPAALSTAPNATPRAMSNAAPSAAPNPMAALAKAVAAPLPPAAAAAPVAASGASAPTLPASGVRAPVQQFVQALVQQWTAPVLPLQVVSLQAWTPALVQWLEAATQPAPAAMAASPPAQAIAAAKPGELAMPLAPPNAAPGALPMARAGAAPGADPAAASPWEGAPALQTWLVRQGVVHTPDGPRGFAMTLRLPLAWVEGQAPAATAAMAAAQAPLVFADRAPALPSMPLALVLQNPAAEGRAARTNAVLTLEFQPLPPTAVYGRETAATRLDPWVQMALLQAHQALAVEEEQARRRAQALCDTPGCPYLARASCVQPFCSAMRRVIPVVPVMDEGEARQP